MVRGRQFCTQLSIFEGSLAEMFCFWCCQLRKLRKTHTIVSFVMLSSSKLEDVSQTCRVFAAVKFKSWGCLADFLRFQACRLQIAARQIDRQTDRQTNDNNNNSSNSNSNSNNSNNKTTTLHYTTHITLITLHCATTTTTTATTTKLHYTTLHSLHCTTLQLQLHYFTLHCARLHYTMPNYGAQHYSTLH